MTNIFFGRNWNGSMSRETLEYFNNKGEYEYEKKYSDRKNGMDHF